MVFFIPIWVYRDAKKRGMNPLGWALVVFFANGFVGFIIYLVIRGPLLEEEEIYYTPPTVKSRGGINTIRCPHCKELVDRGYAHCPHCGERLKEDCPYCHKPIEPEWKRCAHCGEPIPDYVR